MSGEPLCGSESPASVTVDDSVTSSASGARVHLPIGSDGSEGSSVVVKRFRKRPLPEHDPPEESLLLDHAASPRDSEVPSSISPSSFVLIGNHETFCLPSPKFAVRPRVGLLQDNSGPVFRRELAPNRLDGFSRPAWADLASFLGLSLVWCFSLRFMKDDGRRFFSSGRIWSRISCHIAVCFRASLQAGFGISCGNVS